MRTSRVRSARRRAAFRPVLVLALAGGAALAVTAACSLGTDLRGLSSGDLDGSVPDAAADATVAQPVADGPNEVAPPRCRPSTVIDTPLSAELGTWTTRTLANAGYPKVETFFGAPAGVLFPFVDVTPVPIDAGNPDAGPTFYTPPERYTAVAGVWHPSPVALRSFDVELDLHVRCTSDRSCADGVGVFWLDTTIVPDPKDDTSGHRLGLPYNVNGAGVVLDDLQNDEHETSDPPSPSLQVVQIDGTRPLGAYPWTTASKGAAFLGAWHRVGIALRDDTVTVTYDGAPALTSLVPRFARGVFGITAGTGGSTDAVAVRNVKASFYDCTP